MGAVNFGNFKEVINKTAPGNEMKNIGGFDAHWQVPVMMVVKENGQFAYLKDKPIHFAIKHRVIKCKGIHRCFEEQVFLRMEFFIGQADSEIANGDSLIISTFPRENGRVVTQRFKSSFHQEKYLKATFENDLLLEAVKKLEHLNYDYFETGKYLVAGFSHIDEPSLLGSEKCRNYHFEKMVFGHCKDLDQCVAEIYQTGFVQNLLDLTLKNKLKFSRTKDFVPLYPETIEMAEIIMLTSIKQALAGPANSKEIKDNNLTSLLRFIYLDHLNNANRRVNRNREMLMAPRDMDMKRTEDSMVDLWSMFSRN